jgi:biotin transporter BioY
MKIINAFKLGFLKADFYKQAICHSFITQFLFSLSLSWLYAITAQMILPIYPVVITVLPLPIYLMVYSFGSPAAYAFILYLLQGVVGAPFFAHMRSGWQIIVGPSGGYLMGMVIAAIALALLRNVYKNNWRTALLFFIAAEVVVFACGLAQLSFFVPREALLLTGLYYFAFGEVLKVIAATLFVAWKSEEA